MTQVILSHREAADNNKILLKILNFFIFRSLEMERNADKK